MIFKICTVNNSHYFLLQKKYTLDVAFVCVSPWLVVARYNSERSIKQLEQDRCTHTERQDLDVSKLRKIILKTPQAHQHWHSSYVFVIERYASTYPKGTPMDYAGGRFQQWTVVAHTHGEENNQKSSRLTRRQTHEY